MTDGLLENLKFSEGFRGEPYSDSLGFLTIGYGTKLPLSKEEAEQILVSRLSAKIIELQTKKPVILELSENAQNALFEMAYQLGVNGLLKFKKMWKALEKKDFKKASLEALDSRWAKQTPNRANRIAQVIREG